MCIIYFYIRFSGKYFNRSEITELRLLIILDQIFNARVGIGEIVWTITNNFQSIFYFMKKKHYCLRVRTSK